MSKHARRIDERVTSLEVLVESMIATMGVAGGAFLGAYEELRRPSDGTGPQAPVDAGNANDRPSTPPLEAVNVAIIEEVSPIVAELIREVRAMRFRMSDICRGAHGVFYRMEDTTDDMEDWTAFHAATGWDELQSQLIEIQDELSAALGDEGLNPPVWLSEAPKAKREVAEALDLPQVRELLGEVPSLLAEAQALEAQAAEFHGRLEATSDRIYEHAPKADRSFDAFAIASGLSQIDRVLNSISNGLVNPA